MKKQKKYFIEDGEERKLFINSLRVKRKKYKFIQDIRVVSEPKRQPRKNAE